MSSYISLFLIISSLFLSYVCMIFFITSIFTYSLALGDKDFYSRSLKILFSMDTQQSSPPVCVCVCAGAGGHSLAYGHLYY